MISSCIVGAARAEEALGEIHRAWTARSERVRSARFSWEESNFILARSIMSEGTRGPRVVAPAADMTISLSRELRLQGKMIRYSYQGPQWIDALGEFRNRSYLSVTDGRVSKHFFDKDNSSGEFYASGFINKDAAHTDARSQILLPLLVLYRPFDPTVLGGTYDTRKYTVTAERGKVGSVECVILQHIRSTNERRNLLWLDPGREWLPMRLTTIAGGYPKFQIDLWYKQQGTDGWVPSGWKTTVFADTVDKDKRGLVFREYLATNVQSEFNIVLSEAEFQYDFPADTEVVDYRKGFEWYIARPEGRKRIVTKAEQAANLPYERLVATESGFGVNDGSRGGVAWMLIATLAALVAVAAYAVRRSVRRRQGVVRA